MMESFSVKQTDNVFEIEKISSSPPSMIAEVEKISPNSPFLRVELEREKTYSKKNDRTSIVFNETVTVFEKSDEDWIVKFHRINKKTIGLKGEVVEEKFDLKREINPENEYVKNMLAKGSQFEDVAGSTSTIELIPKGKVVEEKINVQDQGTFKPELGSTSTSKGEEVDEKLEVEMKINHENEYANSKLTIELIPKGKVVEEKINVQDQGTFKPELGSTSTSKGEEVDEKLEVEMKINHENENSKLAEMNKGSQFEDVAGSTSSNELITKSKVVEEKFNVQDQGTFKPEHISIQGRPKESYVTITSIKRW